MAEVKKILENLCGARSHAKAYELRWDDRDHPPSLKLRSRRSRSRLQLVTDLCRSLGLGGSLLPDQIGNQGLCAGVGRGLGAWLGLAVGVGLGVDVGVGVDVAVAVAAGVGVEVEVAVAAAVAVGVGVGVEAS